MNDVVHLAMMQAAGDFSASTTFNAACFSRCLTRIAGVSGVIDGLVVAAIMAGRTDVVRLKGGAHYQLLEPKEKPPA